MVVVGIIRLVHLDRRSIELGSPQCRSKETQVPPTDLHVWKEADDAAHVLGAQVRIAREILGWSADELADRAGVGVHTVLQLEVGGPTVMLGEALTIAVVAGVPLYDITDHETLLRLRGTLDKVLTLFPSNPGNQKEPGVSTDF
jgi:DNA-binding XRE family transcriptional regulator